MLPPRRKSPPQYRQLSRTGNRCVFTQPRPERPLAGGVQVLRV